MLLSAQNGVHAHADTNPRGPVRATHPWQERGQSRMVHTEYASYQHQRSLGSAAAAGRGEGERRSGQSSKDRVWKRARWWDDRRVFRLLIITLVCVCISVSGFIITSLSAASSRSNEYGLNLSSFAASPASSSAPASKPFHHVSVDPDWSEGAYYVTSGDINNDGRSEVAFSNNTSACMALYLYVWTRCDVRMEASSRMT